MVSNGTITVPVTLKTAGTQAVTATAMGLTPGTASITVSPGAFMEYVVAVVGSSTVQAGTGFQVNMQAADAYGNPITSGYSGPATVTLTSSPTSAASNFPGSASINSIGSGTYFGMLDIVGSYVITATGTSGSSSFTGSTTTPVTVTPAAPRLLVFGTQPVNTPTGDVLPTVSVQILDQFGNLVTTDNHDSVTMSVGSGPGSFLAGSTTTVTAHGGVANFSNLALGVLGSYTLQAVLPSISTFTNSASFTVTPLQVIPSSFVGTPSGFSLQFNAPFLVNSTTPVLYGHGFGAAGTVPSLTLAGTVATGTASLGTGANMGQVASVTVINGGNAYLQGSAVTFTGGGGEGAAGIANVGPNGAVTSVEITRPGSGYTSPPTVVFAVPYVQGSVVLNTATNSLTFVETNTSSLASYGTPLLPDGSYTVVLHGSAANDGFQALNSGGGFLDGLATGIAGSGDYTTTFTVGATAAGDDVVWVPPSADGPGQPLNGPGNDQAGGGFPVYLANSTGTVTSVSATLTYNPAVLTLTSGPGSPGLTVTVTAPGTATLSYSGPALPAGAETPIGYIGWSGPQPTPTLASGGTLTSGTTYYYVVTATDGGNEPLASLQSIPVTTTASQQTVVLTWPQGVFATGYKVYRSTTSGSGYSLLATIGSGATLTYTDNGSQTPTTGTPPVTGSTASVSSGTVANPVPYKTEDLLQLSGVMLNGGTIPVVTSDGLHLVAYVADADGNGSYSNNDATLITRVLLQADTGFTAYPLVDPVIVADTDGDGFFPADAALQANEAGVGLAAPNLPIPAIPSGVVFVPIANNVDPTDPVSSLVDLLGTTESVTSTSAETTNPNSPALAPESGEQSLNAGLSALADMTTEHAFGVVAGHGTATFVASTSALLSPAMGMLAAPLAGLVIQFGNVPPFIAPVAGLGVGQYPVDQVFQTLGVGTMNPTPLATVKNVFGRVLAGQPMLWPSGVDTLDSQWDEVYSDLDCQGIALPGGRARRDGTIDSAPPMMAQYAAADPGALDLYFAQMADDADQGVGDE